MIKLIKISLLLLLPSFLFAQGGIVNDGAKIQVSAGTDVKIAVGGVINQSTGEITNAGNIYLDRNWSQTGAATYTGTGWMWFENGTNQNLTSATALTVPRLRVDNGDKVILGSSVTVSTQVDLMSDGKIELGTNNLILSPGATMANYGLNAYVITNSTGFLQKEVGGTAVDFPVGITNYNLATLSNAGTVDNLQVRLFEQVFDQGTTGAIETAGVVDRTWMISEETVGGSNMTMTLQWNTPDELTFDRTACGIAHHTSGTLWDNPPTFTPATPVGAAWSQTRSGFTSFSPFVVRDLSVDLPVELLYYNAVRNSIDKVNLGWTTASELNNQGFDVERMLQNETEFTKIAWVDGNGTTTNNSYYNLIDENGYDDVSYYRLKQIDFDGTFSYSDIKAVSGWKFNTDLVDIFPNPIHDHISIRLTSNTKEVTLRILDAKGALIRSQVKAVPADKLIQLNDLNDLADGVYMLTITTDDGNVFSKKLIKKQP